MTQLMEGISRKTAAGVIIVCLLGWMSSCAGKEREREKIQITVSVFPLMEFARDIAGERGEVSLLLPAGAGVHTWQPRASDIVKLSTSDLFIFIGANLEPWLHDILKGISNPDLKILEASRGLDLIEEEDHASHEHGEEEEAGHNHSHEDGVFDPHIWLDFSYDQIIVDRIAETLATIDPDGGPDFRRNAAALKQKLMELDQKFRENLEDCLHRTIILGGHAAFGYLAKRYDLRQIALYGLSPDSKPTPGKLIEIIELAKEHQIRVVYFETTVSPDLARAISREIGARTLVLNPGVNLTKKQLDAHVSFFDIMEENLIHLREGLVCR